MANGLVCFDFDDTLLLTEAAKAAHFCTVARQHHGEAGETLMKSLGGDRFERFDKYAEEVVRRGIQPVGAQTEPLTGKQLVAQYCDEVAEIIGSRCAEVHGAKAALEYLKEAGVPAFLNSATPHEDLFRAVQARGWTSYFDGIFGRPVGVPTAQSKIANLKLCVDKIGVSADRVVMVGDGETDRVAAEEFGCAFVGIRGAKPFIKEVAHLADDMVDGLRLVKLLMSTEASPPQAKKPCSRLQEFQRVLQTDFTAGSGNALQAAVASIFGAALADTPNFIAAPEGYEAALAAWSQTKGSRMSKVALDKDGCFPAEAAAGLSPSIAGSLCVVRGTSPRGEHGHVVVGRINADGKTLKMVHDPHPDGTMLKSPLVWCALFSPVLS